MKRFFTLSTLAAVALSPSIAAAQTTPAEQAFIQAFLQFDCVMIRETEDDVVAAMELSEEDAAAAADALFAQGLFEEREDQLVMLHPECPNAGVAAAPSGPGAAIAWMLSLGPDQSADVLAELIAARGCVIAEDDFALFQGEVAAAVGRRFSFNETALPLEEMEPFMDALDTMGERGYLQLARAGRIADGAEGVQLLECGVEGDAATAPISEDALRDRLVALASEGVAEIENQALADVTCQFPADMGYNFSAMVLDRVMAAVDFDLGPARALAVMGPSRIGQFYSGEYETAFSFASGMVNDTVNGMVRDGRLEQRGRMMVGTQCEPTSRRPDALLPYLTGGQ